MQYSLPNIGYLTFIAEQKRFLAFGFLMAFVSSAGQTFFIGAFGPSIRAEFDISHGTWGGIYMLGTLMSAAFLPWTGQLFDRMTLPRFASVVALALVIASTFMANVPNVVLLVFAIFLLRQSGQGLASHIASTSMAYRYRKNRGKAIAIALLGFSAGEALLPLLAVMAIAAYGWRATYGGVAVILAIFLPPLLWYLLRERPARKSDLADAGEDPRAFRAAGLPTGEDETAAEDRQVRRRNRRDLGVGQRGPQEAASHSEADFRSLDDGVRLRRGLHAGKGGGGPVAEEGAGGLRTAGPSTRRGTG